MIFCFSELLKKGKIIVCGSPILLSEYSEKAPTEEIVFLSGKGLGFLTEKIFENESGQSIILGLFILSLGYTALYFNGMAAATARKMQILHATKFNQIGIPFYTARAIPLNPLLRPKRM